MGKKFPRPILSKKMGAAIADRFLKDPMALQSADMCFEWDEMQTLTMTVFVSAEDLKAIVAQATADEKRPESPSPNPYR